MRCRFLCLLVPEIDCIYLYKLTTKGNDILTRKNRHMEDFWVLRYPKIVSASCINHFISLALYLWLCILRYLHRVFWCPELIPGDSFMIWLLKSNIRPNSHILMRHFEYNPNMNFSTLSYNYILVLLALLNNYILKYCINHEYL